MGFYPEIVDLKMADKNESNGLYQFIATLKNGKTKLRVFYKKTGDVGTVTNIARLPIEPCPLCYRDTNCNCLDKFGTEIGRQLHDKKWLTPEFLAK